MTNPTLSKKLSAKTIIGNVKVQLNKLDRGEDFAPLFRVTGTIKEIKTGNSNFGAWIAYVGDVAAVNMLTGEIFQGKELFLPEVAELVLEPVAQIVKDGGVVDIALEVSGALRDTSVGYEYRVAPLFEMTEQKSRAQALLTQFAPTGAPLLGAPAKAADESGPQEGQPAPETAPESAKKGKK